METRVNHNYRVPAVAKGVAVPIFGDGSAMLLPSGDDRPFKKIPTLHAEQGFWYDPVLQFWRQKRCGWVACQRTAAVHLWAPTGPISVLLCADHADLNVIVEAAQRKGTDVHVDRIGAGGGSSG